MLKVQPLVSMDLLLFIIIRYTSATRYHPARSMELSQYKDSITFVASGSDNVSSGLGIAFNETINNGIVHGVEEGNNLTQTILDNASGIFRLLAGYQLYDPFGQ